MPEKPNPSSVTTLPCSCGLLAQQAAEPETPLEFDATLGEYQLRCSEGGRLRVFHCPFCGGAAPRSERNNQFALLTWHEIRRLEELTSAIRTPEEAIAIFGSPDEEMERDVTVQTPATPDGPSRVESFRTLLFRRLSETAEIPCSRRRRGR